jgi:Putative zinc-finger
MNCLEEGRLQALIDGELSADARREAEAHLASCHACAAAREEAAQECALFSQAFAVEGSLNVPTERLRASVASAVAEMRAVQATDRVAVRESSGGRARSFWSSLAASFAPRQIAVFAGLALAAVVLAATFLALRPGSQPGKEESQEIAKGTGAPTPVGGDVVATPETAGTAGQINSQDATGRDELAKITPKTIRPELVKISPRGGSPQIVKSMPRPLRPVDRTSGETAAARPGPKTPRPDLLPVEREYVREIAALKTSIERQQLQTLSPTLRAEYERNVAVVDEAIASTRQAVKSNPADKDAQEFLRAAYRDKLDLLSAVAGKSQLASADR